MSDFDRFFAEKLEEEGDFPRRDRNWRQLAQRLDAFDIGGRSQAPRWHYWPAAAAVAISLTVAGWLVWKMEALQQENQALREEIVALRKSAPVGVRPAPLPAEQQQEAVVLGNETQSGSHLLERPPALSANDHPIQTGQSPTRTTTTANKNGQLTHQPDNPSPKANQTKPSANQTQIAADNNLNTSQSITPKHLPAADTLQLANKNNASKAAPTAQVTAASAALDSLHQALPSANKDNEAQASPSAQTTVAPSATDSLRQAQPVPVQDSAQAVLADKGPETVTPPAKLPDTVATALAPAPLIKPLRPAGRFRVGVEAVAGMPLPKQSGISLLSGSGLTVAYAPLPSFRIIASADWLRFDVDTDHFVPEFHAPHGNPPMHPPGPHDELVQVESSQRQQQYSLGLSYALPVHGWLRPAVRVAHTWVHVAPCLVSFRFEEDTTGHGGGPGGPGGHNHDSEYVVKKFDPQTIHNVWRFGAGLEHELPRWTFGLWADYSKNLAATENTYDAWMLRAAVQYKFN